MTGFATQIRHIHPFLPQEEDKANELVLLRLSYMERVPCPAPPLYGRELQVHLFAFCACASWLSACMRP